MKIITLFVVILMLLSACIYAQEQAKKDSRKDQIVSTLNNQTSDKMQGRKAGTEGANFAAEYIAEKFKDYQLVPLSGDSYYQDFNFIAGVKSGKTNNLAMRCGTPEQATMKFSVSKDYTPLAFSKSAQVTGEIVFAGYGITAPELKYDDYKDVNVENKIVLIIRHYPDENNEKNPFKKAQYQSFGDLHYKISNAQDHKVAGVIIINDMPNHPESQDDLINLNEMTTYGSASVPAIQVKRKELFALAKECKVTIEEMESSIAKKMLPASQELKGMQVEVNVELDKQQKVARNVIGMVKGKSDEVIIVGAHYDHIGTGTENSRDMSAKGKVHPGADDNASGVAAVLELAKQFGEHKDMERSIVVMAFSAEELGIQGSTYFVNSGAIDIKKIVAMINMDMIGRMKNNTLMIGGIETANEFKAMMEKIKPALTIRYSGEGYGPSDHAAFYNKNVPVLFFFTGAHPDHHTPKDTVDKINLQGIEIVIDLVAQIVDHLELPDTKLTFHRVKEGKPLDMVGKGFGAYLGTIPDFSYNDEGVRISGVREGSPAETASLKEGDIIIQFGEKKIHNLYDYSYALRAHKPGDKVTIIYLRDGKESTATATLSTRTNQ